MSISTSPAAQSSATWNSFYAYARYFAATPDSPIGDLIADIRADKSFPMDIDGPEDLQLYIALPAKLIKQAWRNYVQWLDANNAELPAIRSKPLSKTERRRLRIEELPYGCWTTASGRQILFNRKYRPLWQRTQDGQAQPANRYEWVPDITATTHFYKSSTDETEDHRLFQAIAAAKSWGIPLPDLYSVRIDIHNA